MGKKFPEREDWPTQGTVAAKREGRRQDLDQTFRGSGFRKLFVFGSSKLAGSLFLRASSSSDL